MAADYPENGQNALFEKNVPVRLTFCGNHVMLVIVAFEMVSPMGAASHGPGRAPDAVRRHDRKTQHVAVSFFPGDFHWAPILASRPVRNPSGLFFSTLSDPEKCDPVLLYVHSTLFQFRRNLFTCQKSLPSILQNQIRDDGLSVSERKRSLRRLPKLMAKSGNYQEELSAGAAPRTGCQTHPARCPSLHLEVCSVDRRITRHCEIETVCPR
jgi:hypothetical protein